jgi:hypothetical protein
MEADAFCEYLSAQGIRCDERASQLSQWIETSADGGPQPDRVYVHIALPERLGEIPNLYRAWHDSAAGSASPLG